VEDVDWEGKQRVNGLAEGDRGDLERGSGKCSGIGSRKSERTHGGWEKRGKMSAG